MIEWKPIKSTNKLNIGDIVFYKTETQEFLARVKFTTNTNYLVISPYTNPAVGIVVNYLSNVFIPDETVQTRVQQVHEGSNGSEATS